MDLSLELEVKCRACLAEGVPMLNLFDIYEHDLTLAAILHSCVDTEVNENDGLPKFLCETCITTVTEFYNFSVIYEQNVMQLKETIEEQNKEFYNSGQYDYDIKHDIRQLISPVEDSVASKSDETEQTLVLNPVAENVCESSVEEDDSLVNDNASIVYVKAEDVTNESEEVIDTYEPDEYVSDLEESPSSPSQSSDKRDDERVFFESEDGILYEQVNKYECKDCGDTFLYASGISFHMLKRHKMHDVDAKQYCTKVMIKAKNNPPNEDDVLIYPSEVATDDNFGLPRCQVCRAVFTTQEALREHQQIHKTYVCEVCGSSYIKKSYLEDHKEAHGTDKRYKCKFCDKCFKRRTVLVKHKRIHTHPRQCVCEVCGKRFNDKGTLKTHTLLLHIKERKFKCMICNHNFPLKSTLDKHISRHMKREKGEKDFSCDRCEMKYRDKSSLTRHVASKHSGVDCRITCQDCGKVYTSTTNLFKHRRIHHKELLFKEGDLKVKVDGASVVSF